MALFDRDKGGLPAAAALAVVTGAMALTGWSGQRFSPTPLHPRTMVWYFLLRKPQFTPPGPVFGGAWGVIEGILAYGGYRLLRRKPTPERNAAVALWTVNNLLIAGWSALFFGRKALGVSAATAGGMIGAASAYALVAAKTDKTAAATAVPLIAWLAFAALLAEEVWRRND